MRDGISEGDAMGARVAGATTGRRDQATAFVCVTCGTQYPESAGPPAHCPICEDERQYVGPDGQAWTTLDELRRTHRNVIKQQEEGLYSIHTEPTFGIGQRAFLIQTPTGNLLWDCVGLIDDVTVARLNELGGIAAMAISHPHYYTSMIEWSRAFGNVPIHIHEAERAWVMRPSPCIRFWSGESQEILGGLSLVRTGGHFEGYQVLVWPAGAEGRGVLMAGDQPQIGMDPRQVSFMWSYPNYIPLNASTIQHILSALDAREFDRIYGAFSIRGKGVVPFGGKEVVRRSAKRYLEAIQG